MNKIKNLTDLIQKRDELANALRSVYATVENYLDDGQRANFNDHLWSIIGTIDAEINMMQNNICIKDYQNFKLFQWRLN